MPENERDPVDEARFQRMKELEPSQRQATIFRDAFREIARLCHENAADKGFWDGGIRVADIPLRIALLHSELSEAFEAYRCDTADDHLLEERGFAVELADVIIRIMDMSAAFELDVGRLVIEKMVFNIGRSKMHGGKKF